MKVLNENISYSEYDKKFFIEDRVASIGICKIITLEN